MEIKIFDKETIYVNSQKRPYINYRAYFLSKPGSWADGETQAEAIGKLIMKLFPKSKP